MSEEDGYTKRLDIHAMERELACGQHIELFFQGKLVSVTLDDLPYQLGRDESSCDMVIYGETVSRKHCALQVRDRQIGLLDESTNGTYLRVGRNDSVCVHNDFHPLVGQGVIKLGHRIDMDDAELIFYKVVKTQQ